MKHLYPIVILFQLLFTSNTIAQDSSSKKSFVKFNMNYLSNAIYFARKDASSVPYLRSSITFNDKSGFYAGGGVSLLVSSNEPSRIDMINIDGGYSFNLGKIDAGVFASKFFYSNASYAVGSELKGITGFYFDYNLGFASIGGGGDLLFSTNTDINANLNVNHEFEAGEENNHWTFTPAIQANAGTQFFNEAYYVFRKFTFPTKSGNGGSNSGSSNSGKGSGKGHSNSSNSGSGNSTTTTTVKTVTFYDRNRFTILDVELSVPVTYARKRWGLYANPVLAFPVNAATYAIDNSIQKEKLSTAFFTEIGVYIKF